MKAKEKYKNHHREINQKKSQTQWREETQETKEKKEKKVYSKTYGINTNKCIYRPGRPAVSHWYSSSRDVALEGSC